MQSGDAWMAGRKLPWRLSWQRAAMLWGLAFEPAEWGP